jgi:hypothetical protein
MDFLAGTREILTHQAQGHCQGGESTCQPRVRVFSSEQIPVTLSALPNNTVDSPFVRTPSTFAAVLAFLVAHCLGHLPHLLALPCTAYAVQKHSISS